MKPSEVIEKARANCGGWAQLATTCGATRQSLYRWRNGAVPSPRFWYVLAFSADVDVAQILAAWGIGTAVNARKPLAQ